MHARIRRVRWRPALVAAAALLGGIGVFQYAHGLVRDFGGDVLVVVFLVAVLATFDLGRSVHRVVGVVSLALLTEAVQGLGWVTRDSHWLLHLTLGSTYDPVDLVCYAIGGVVAAGMEWAYRMPSAAPVVPS